MSGTRGGSRARSSDSRQVKQALQFAYELQEFTDTARLLAASSELISTSVLKTNEAAN